MQLAIDKKRIADSFSRAAATYDSVAGLQRDVALALLDSVQPYQSAEPRCVIDLGCGTGFVSGQLHQRIDAQQHIAIDLAHGMLQQARTQLPSDIQLSGGDAEALPLCSGAVDQLYTSLAIQWCESPQRVFAEISRALAPGGIAAVATLGPNTLHELKQAWAQVDNYQHVNHFVDLDTLTEQLPRGLTPLLVKQENRTLRYAQLRELTTELKQLGAHNMNAGEAKGLTGPQRVKRFRAAYEALRADDGKLPATYQVYYLILRKEHHG